MKNYKLLAISLVLLWTSPLFAIDLEIIKQIESGGNSKAISNKGAIGSFQITEACLKDFNQALKAHYVQKDLYDAMLNERIASWYINKRIPQLLRHFHKPITLENILICYNAGIRAVVKGYLPKETRNYILKYKRLSND